MLHAYDVLYETLKNAGHAPKLYILDNELSTEFNQLLQKERTVVQPAPPHIHRINTAECAIQTFKNHFVAGLASVDNNFPIYL